MSAVITALSEPRMMRLLLFLSGSASVFSTQAVADVLVDGDTSNRVILKDAAIIGGGASGAFAAVRLREDYNKSIILIEKQKILVPSTFPDPTQGLLTS